MRDSVRRLSAKTRALIGVSETLNDAKDLLRESYNNYPEGIENIKLCPDDPYYETAEVELSWRIHPQIPRDCGYVTTSDYSPEEIDVFKKFNVKTGETSMGSVYSDHKVRIGTISRSNPCFSPSGVEARMPRDVMKYEVIKEHLQHHYNE